MGRAIFISYRRDDTEGEAGRLFDDLVRTFGGNSVFMDVDGINPGMDFRKAIDDNVASCGVLLAMIGPTWAAIADSTGQRRLDDHNDFVRLEIASALGRNIAVIPVLVHGAKMPRPDELPDNLKDLAYRNSVEITHTRWNSDVQLLIAALGQYVGASKATSSEPVHATVSVQLPPANPPVLVPAPARKSRMPLYAGIGVAAVLVIAAIAYFALPDPDAPGAKSDGAATTTAPAEKPRAAPAASPEDAKADSAAPVAQAKPDERSDAPLAGTWTNSEPIANNGLVKLQISLATSNSPALLHAWGKCEPDDCDWGEQEGRTDSDGVTATWKVEGAETRAKDRVATVTAKPDGEGIRVVIVNEFPDRHTVKKSFEFERAK